jgi:hypothetical protein
MRMMFRLLSFAVDCSSIQTTYALHVGCDDDDDPRYASDVFNRLHREGSLEQLA